MPRLVEARPGWRRGDGSALEGSGPESARSSLSLELTKEYEETFLTPGRFMDWLACEDSKFIPYEQQPMCHREM